MDLDDDGMCMFCATVYKHEHRACFGVLRRVHGRVLAHIHCVFALREGQDRLKLTSKGMT